jgi:putative flippase GtrA
MNHGKSGWLGTSRRLWHGSLKLRFLVIGGWNTFFGYLCFSVLYLLAADYLHYLIIAIIAHIVNVIQAYVMQRRVVFRSDARIVSEFLRFNASLIGTLLFNLLAMYLLVTFTAVSPLLAQAIVILTSLIVTYVLHNRISFARRAEEKIPPS